MYVTFVLVEVVIVLARGTFGGSAHVSLVFDFVRCEFSVTLEHIWHGATYVSIFGVGSLIRSCGVKVVKKNKR